MADNKFPVKTFYFCMVVVIPTLFTLGLLKFDNSLAVIKLDQLPLVFFSVLLFIAASAYIFIVKAKFVFNLPISLGNGFDKRLKNLSNQPVNDSKIDKISVDIRLTPRGARKDADITFSYSNIKKLPEEICFPVYSDLTDCPNKVSVKLITSSKTHELLKQVIRDKGVNIIKARLPISNKNVSSRLDLNYFHSGLFDGTNDYWFFDPLNHATKVNSYQITLYGPEFQFSVADIYIRYKRIPIFRKICSIFPVGNNSVGKFEYSIEPIDSQLIYIFIFKQSI